MSKEINNKNKVALSDRAIDKMKVGDPDKSDIIAVKIGFFINFHIFSKSNLNNFFEIKSTKALILGER